MDSENLKIIKWLRPDSFLRDRDPFLREVHNALFTCQNVLHKDEKFYKAAEEYALSSTIKIEDAFKPTEEELKSFPQPAFIRENPFNFDFSEITPSETTDGGEANIPAEGDLQNYLPTFIVNDVLAQQCWSYNKPYKNLNSMRLEAILSNYFQANMKKINAPPGFPRASPLFPYATVFLPQTSRTGTGGVGSGSGNGASSGSNGNDTKGNSN